MIHSAKFYLTFVVSLCIMLLIVSFKLLVSPKQTYKALKRDYDFIFKGIDNDYPSFYSKAEEKET
jgi:hypothetical protein